MNLQNLNTFLPSWFQFSGEREIINSAAEEELYRTDKTLEENRNNKNPKKVKKDKTVRPPAGRVSYSEYDNNNLFTFDSYHKPEFELEFIPKIRRLSKTNGNLGSVYNDLIQLTNTGHQVKFDQSIDPALADKMKKHLESRSKNWGSGVHGIEGLINKWVGQIWISGAISNEWVPNRNLTGILNNVLINPENIVFKYNSTTTKYEAYQIVKNKIIGGGDINVVKLNPNTFVYTGILGDTDSPYGIPPFITALESISTQKLMRKNINHILKQLGILGYLEVKVSKPQQSGKLANDAKYEQHLDHLLTQTKKNVIEGFADGVVVGFDEDHEFNFHSTTKQLNGVSDLYNQNEVDMANGLKTSPSFLGQKSGGTETNMGIVFTKMLSQLKSVQAILANNLKIGYLLELTLAGFDVRSTDFKVEFNQSTITDDLKFWQTKEIKQRVTKALLIDGVIGPDAYAEANGEAKPFGKPIIPFKDQAAPKSENKTGPEAKAKRNEVRKKSDRRSRDKKKEQPRRKERDTKKR